MKNFNDLNHYEILQIPIEASSAEIEQAYKDAVSIYGVDALSTYCLFSENEREHILALIEAAYSTLIDKDKRAAYDHELAASGQSGNPIPSNSKTTSLSPSLSCYLDRKKHLPDSNVVGRGTGNQLYSLEIMQLLDSCRKNIDILKKDRLGIKNRLKLSWMKEKLQNKSMSEIEPELLAILTEIEASSLRWQRKISLIIGVYTLVAIAGFIILAVTNAIMLPGFNIPYSILLMGLTGCILSMWLRLPNIRSERSLQYDLTVWYIICPPVAVAASGMFYGVAQILLSMFQIDLSDESWVFWIPAFAVGFVNWVYLYERLRGVFALRSRSKKKRQSEIQ